MSVPAIKKNVAGQEVFFPLFDATGDIVLAPVPQAGDFQISLDGGAFGNVTNIPTVTPAGGGQLRWQPTQDETNADHIGFRGVDQVGAAWSDLFIDFYTSPIQLNDIATQVWTYVTRTLTSFGTLATDVQEILDRIGPFDTTGANTIFNFFKALARKDAPNPSQMGGTYNTATDSQEALAEKTLVSFPAGAVSLTYTVTDSVTGLPVEGVEVWIATDVAGTNIIWKGNTDVFGVARDSSNGLPWLDAGTYYIWTQKGQYGDGNPQTLSVS
jgi:hypothetical protein